MRVHLDDDVAALRRGEGDRVRRFAVVLLLRVDERVVAHLPLVVSEDALGAALGGADSSKVSLERRACVQALFPISLILDFSRRLTIVVKRSCCELVHQEWLTTARGHTVASCDERGLACAAHTDVVYIHICGHVSAGSGHGFRIFPWPNNRCCSGANGRLPLRHWHASQQ